MEGNIIALSLMSIVLDECRSNEVAVYWTLVESENLMSAKVCMWPSELHVMISSMNITHTHTHIRKGGKPWLDEC